MERYSLYPVEIRMTFIDRPRTTSTPIIASVPKENREKQGQYKMQIVHRTTVAV